LADFLRQDDPIAAKVGFIPRNLAAVAAMTAREHDVLSMTGDIPGNLVF
jgi:hypothetical protein